MRRRVWMSCAAGLVTTLLAIGGGCGSSAKSNGFDAPDDGGPASSDEGGGGSVGDADTPSFGDASDASGGTKVHCSSDLHDVVDENGNVLEVCPPDQGCTPTGGCVPACDAATANKSTIGCDYYSVDPDVIAGDTARCFAAFVANTWTAPVTLTIDRAGTTYSAAQVARIPSGNGKAITYAPLPNGQLPPGQVAILFLANGPGSTIPCPAGITPAYTTADAALHGTGLGAAFHITASAPIVAYDVYPYGGGDSAITSSTLLLPTTAWDTNYVAVNAYAKSAVSGGVPSLDVVAQEDGTTVTLLPQVAVVAGAGVAGGAAGKPLTYTLNKGQILQFSQAEELTGSPIQADKPIAVWGSASCLNIPVAVGACDGAHQQIPPVKALGHEYVAVRYRSRIDGQDESVPWRLVGAVDGTTLTYEPAPPAGAPTTLTLGQFVSFDSPGPFTVKSQDDKHPFYMSGHMTGCQSLTGSPIGCAGDPEFVNVIPPQEYLASYTFFTDPTYPETNLVVVRTKQAGGWKDVTLDCAGVLQGWQPAGSSGTYEYTRIDLVRHDFAKQGNCDNGRHEVHSDAPFGLTVWGWGTSETGAFFSQAVSYAYPAGASVQPINTVVVPPVPR